MRWRPPGGAGAWTPPVWVPSLTVVAVGALWGLYWVPLRQFDAVAGAGPWATAIALAVASLCLAPAAWRGRRRLRTASWPSLAGIALGGVSFALYSNGLLYGQVAVVTLLFYLTPVWSTLIARFWLQRPVSWPRYAALGCGLAGIALVLRGGHGGLPWPHALGDWLGLASGLLWAVASTVMHGRAGLRPAETNFMFCASAGLVALAMACSASQTPHVAPEHYAQAAAWALILGGLWWATALSAFLWATRILEPARVGILLMSEAVVAVVSAALWAGEPVGAVLVAGTVLVITAGALEALSYPARAAGH